METEHDTSLLKEMFQKALIDSKNEFAVSMFSTMIRNDPTLIPQAIQLILDIIKLNDSSQSIRSLELLDECMNRSGPEFQTEISKYRFLNELSKLVSNKYNGDTTLKEIKDKIMYCFLLWTAQFPEKDKIKSVYECLKKEGVQDASNSNSNSVNLNTCQRKTDFVDEENEKKLKKLLQSNSKEDVKKANLLIQHLVKQDEKKRERIHKQKAELKEVQNTVQLFNEVISTFIEENSKDENQSTLLEDLFNSCMKYKHMISKMPDIMEDTEEELIRDTIRINDLLLEAIDRYNNLKSSSNAKSDSKSNKNLDGSLKNTTEHVLDDLLSVSVDQPKTNNIETEVLSSKNNPLDELADIFAPTSLTNSNCLTPAPVLFKQINENGACSVGLENNIQQRLRKDQIFAAIDDLSEDLFKKSLNETQRNKTFNKDANIKVSLNELSKMKYKSIDNEITEDISKNLLEKTFSNESKNKENQKSFDKDKLLLLENENIDEKSSQIIEIPKFEENQTTDEIPKPEIVLKPKINYLSEVELSLDDIEPDNLEPITLMDCKEGLKVILNFAKNHPLDFTSVIVVSTINQSSLPIDDFLFDAFVNKPCKLRLLKRNGNCLPGVKPFRPPSECLQQIMLVYNPTETPVGITFTFSYKQGDDPDPVKESLSSTIPYIH